MRCMLRVYRLAVAIDMIEAGTRAPIAMAANAKPTNQDGNKARNNAGTAKLGPYCLKLDAKSGMSPTPAAMAMYPSNAIRPRRNVYAGNSAELRMMARRLLALSTPVTECGYRKSAKADPSASVA